MATIDIADDAKMSDLWRLRKLEEKIIAENRDLFNLRHILAIREMVHRAVRSYMVSALLFPVFMGIYWENQKFTSANPYSGAAKRSDFGRAAGHFPALQHLGIYPAEIGNRTAAIWRRIIHQIEFPGRAREAASNSCRYPAGAVPTPDHHARLIGAKRSLLDPNEQRGRPDVSHSGYPSPATMLWRLYR